MLTSVDWGQYHPPPRVSSWEELEPPRFLQAAGPVKGSWTGVSSNLSSNHAWEAWLRPAQIILEDFLEEGET